MNISIHNLPNIPGLTPLVAIILCVVAGYGIYKIIKAFMLAENKPEDMEEYQHKQMIKWGIIKGIGICMVSGFAFFFYFHVFIMTGPKSPQPIQSGYQQVLEEAEAETRTPEQLEADAVEKRDPSGYLDKVGKKETLEESTKEVDDYINKALERAKQADKEN